MTKLRSDGFTIIELLIATAVFSVVLMAISATIVQIGHIYFKGLTEARTQGAARDVMDGVTQALQMSAGQVTLGPSLDNSSDSSTHAICIDTTRYSYKLGQQRANGNHALVADEIPSGCSGSKAQNLSGGSLVGSELLGDNMRLANFSVQQQSNPQVYKVTVRVVYGDDDLLCSPSGDGTKCDSDAVMSSGEIAAARDLKCKNIRSGSQFCAVSNLSTMVERRLK